VWTLNYLVADPRSSRCSSLHTGPRFGADHEGVAWRGFNAISVRPGHAYTMIASPDGVDLNQYFTL
jgi:hypothetical protein